MALLRLPSWRDGVLHESVLALEGRCCLDGLVEVLGECSPEHEADYEPGDLKQRIWNGKG